MDTILQYPYASGNRIAFRNAAFSIEAQGKSADRIADAAVVAILLVGLAVAYKASR